MKVGDYRDQELPWRITTQRELDAQKIECSHEKCNEVAIMRRNSKSPYYCMECYRRRYLND